MAEEAEIQLKYLEETGAWNKIWDSIQDSVTSDPAMGFDLTVNALTFFIPGLGELTAAKMANVFLKLKMPALK